MINEPQFTVKELLDSINDCYSYLCDMNLNGVWPDANPNWDPDYYLTVETTAAYAKKYTDFLAKEWTLNDIKYRGEIIMVKFTNQWLLDYNAYTDNRTFGKEWAQAGKTFYVMGEVAQHRGHFLVTDVSTGKMLPGEFHAYDFKILTNEDEEAGEVVMFNENFKPL